MTITKLQPYLNFNGQANDALALYQRALGAQVLEMNRWSEMPDTPPDRADRIMHAEVRVGAASLMLCDVPDGVEVAPGSNQNVITQWDDLEAAKAAFEALSAEGQILMPLEHTFWQATYGQLVDKFGVRWMFNCPDEPPKPTKNKVRPCLLFAGNGEEAANLYVSLISGSTIDSVFRTAPDQPAMVVELTLGGTQYMFLDYPAHIERTNAASISVYTQDQEETDRVWTALTAEGGQEGMCGWLVDRYGVSWQVVPAALPRIMGSDDRVAAGRAQAAMMKMKKLDIATLEAAFNGE